MKSFEQYNKECEERRIRIWKKMSPTQKHMALMYAYRLRTDIEHIGDYLETFRFHQMGITFDDLPTFIATSSLEDLYRDAYEVIGVKIPPKKVIA